MLVLSRERQTLHDDLFANFPKYLHPGDCLVLNDTRVFPARLVGRRNHATGAEIEVFLVRVLSADESEWQALTRPAKRVKNGDRIRFGPDLTAEVLAEGDFGERTIRLLSARPIRDLLEELGRIPLPPYIHREPDASDRDRYQTTFARVSGSVAAPTAGLHFTPEILDQCQAAGSTVAHVTLHVGLGTFAPVRGNRLNEIQLHEERFEISAENAAILSQARRVVCIGTTSVRTIETAMLRGGFEQMRGETNLFIYPGFRFQATSAMLTNFHLPQSSLLMLVSAFAGREFVLKAYRHAVAERYRFFSYGDCMLID